MKGLVKDVIWLLRRMKQLNVDERTITNYWKAEGRVHLETCAPVWTGGLTVGQARQIQRVQRRAVAAITGGSREVHRLLQPPRARARPQRPEAPPLP